MQNIFPNLSSLSFSIWCWHATCFCDTTSSCESNFRSLFEIFHIFGFLDPHCSTCPLSRSHWLNMLNWPNLIVCLWHNWLGGKHSAKTSKEYIATIAPDWFDLSQALLEFEDSLSVPLFHWRWTLVWPARDAFLWGKHKTALCKDIINRDLSTRYTAFQEAQEV